MTRQLVELRILPPFAISRLGSSPDPMDNYDLIIKDPIGTRQIEPAETLVINRETGEISLKRPPFEVRFRDGEGRIRPIAPFLEVWARRAGDAELVPLTTEVLAGAGLTLEAVKWSVHVANIKAYRRTGDNNDRIEARTGAFSDHAGHALVGYCNNFLDDKSIPLGSVQYIKPSAEFPEIRLRFTPAAGNVYGPPPEPGTADPNIADAVYDPEKGKWKGYFDPSSPDDPKKEPIRVRKATNPMAIYAGKSEGDYQISYGYLDDECDGIVEVELVVSGARLNAHARIAAGPPTFAPDSLPVRTVGDEMEQAMYGPDLDGPVTAQEIADVRDIVRRALETVRLMNTSQMNKPSKQRGVGMARMDYLDVNRALESIADPAVADSLAIRSRHERVLLALESGSLAWFARVLRDYDEVGDLSNEKRRKMPALMRNADGRHLALTRRQVSKVRAAAEYFINLGKGDKQ
jgi:hypothetical protein